MDPVASDSSVVEPYGSVDVSSGVYDDCSVRSVSSRPVELYSIVVYSLDSDSIVEVASSSVVD